MKLILKLILSLILVIIFSFTVTATNMNYPNFVSVYNFGKVSLIQPDPVVIDYSMRNKYDVLYHIVEGYDSVENCGTRFLKSGFSNSDMEFYGSTCIDKEYDYKEDKLFDVQLIYENNEIDMFVG